ncbi:MAG: GvpL/GvpF family gas vesicle protein [Bacteroidota bacterium]
MKERSKERMAELLLQELFEQLSERENVKRMLGDMSSLPVDEVVEKLVGDIEQLITRHRLEAVEVLKGKVPAATAPVHREPPNEVKSQQPVESRPRITEPLSPAPSAKPAEPKPSPVIPPKDPQHIETVAPRVEPKIEPPKVELPKIEEKKEPSRPATKEPFWGDIEQELKKAKRSQEPKHIEEQRITPPPIPEVVSIKEEEDEIVEQEVEEREEDDAGVVANVSELRTATDFSDDDVVYLHGVSLIPEHEPHAETPFMLEEKGIDPRGFIFAFDYEGLRFYLSKILPTVMNISKTGMLLLGKQESLQFQGAHESILNDLRMHGIILPFQFGVIARGRDDLMGQIDEHKNEIVETLETLLATKWWVLNLQVLDGRIAQVVGSDTAPPPRKGRGVERVSYSKMPMPKKYDIKMLERMLHREKRLAESVHEELKVIADRGDIDEIVSLGSGSSEEWKSILKASYEVQPQNVMKFFHAVTDLQYRHLMFDLMLSVSGDGEAFSFNEK